MFWKYDTTASLYLNPNAYVIGAKNITGLKNLILNGIGTITLDDVPDGIDVEHPLILSSYTTSQMQLILTKSTTAHNVKVKYINVVSDAMLGVTRADWNLGNNSGKIFHVSQEIH